MKIFQIFYNDLTKNELDAHFIPYDNSNSSLGDWYEYSVIRDILKNQSFGDDEYIGILSPRFFEKTGMTGADVFNIIKKSKADVINFSPRFDQIAYFKNSFYQGDFYHKGLLDLSRRVFSSLGLRINLDALVADQARTIFGNYFVAKRHFWDKYLSISEKIFDISNGDSAIAESLNAKISHRNSTDYTYKIFLMERLITVLLELENINSEIGFDYIKSVRNIVGVEAILGDLMVLDSFKTAFLKTKRIEYMSLYEVHRKRIPLMRILHAGRG